MLSWDVGSFCIPAAFYLENHLGQMTQAFSNDIHKRKPYEISLILGMEFVVLVIPVKKILLFKLDFSCLICHSHEFETILQKL